MQYQPDSKPEHSREPAPPRRDAPIDDDTGLDSLTFSAERKHDDEIDLVKDETRESPGSDDAAPEAAQPKKPRIGMWRGQSYDIDELRRQRLREAGIDPDRYSEAELERLNPPGPDNAYAYAPDRNIAPGWEKRLLIAAAVGIPFVGGLLYMESSRVNSSPEPANGAVKRTLEPEDLEGLDRGVRNVFHDVDEVLSYAKQGRLGRVAVESISEFSGIASYAFDVLREKSETPNPRGANGPRYKKAYLSGIHVGEERDALHDGLRANGIAIQRGTAETGFGQQSSLGLSHLIGGAIAVTLMASLIISIRNQRRMNGAGGGGPEGLQGLAKYSGEVSSKRPSQRFKDIGGLEHVIGQLEDLKTDIEEMQRGAPGIALPKGVLLYGPPGTGKTALVRALAGEAGSPMLQVDGAQLTKMLKGTGPASLAAAFRDARALRDKETARLRQAPGANGREQGVVLLLIDELDSVAGKRAAGAEIGDDERRNIVNTMLQEMDGFDKTRNMNIIVIGASNLADTIDSALLRPGRFSEKVEVPLPTAWQQRLDILRKLEPHIIGAREMTVENDSAMLHLAKVSVGKSGDELRSMLEEAVKIAARAGTTKITQADLFEAFQRQSFGRIREGFLPDEKRELVAYHEHGHGVTALAVGITPLVVSMLARGGSGGRVVLDPQMAGEVLQTQRELLGRVLIGAGGRAAETEKYGPLGITQGARMDFEQIRAVVREMISVGMIEDLYDINLRDLPPHQLRERHSQLINEMVRNAVDSAREIYRLIGDERMDLMTRDSLSIGRELVGQEAQQFYLDRIPADVRDGATRIAERFMADPFGRGTQGRRDAES